MSVGKILKEIRKEKGMTQVEFAKHLDMSRSFIGDIENDRYVPNPNTIQKLADKLNISTYYLTTGEKTFNDLDSDNEFKELRKFDPSVVEDVRQSFVDLDIKTPFKYLSVHQEENLKEKLKNISAAKLGFIEIIILENIIAFLSDADNKDKKSLAASLIQINRNHNIGKNDDLEHSIILDDIERQTEHYRQFLLHRYGYQESSD